MAELARKCTTDADRANNSIPPDNEAEERSEVEYGSTELRVHSRCCVVEEACWKRESERNDGTHHSVRLLWRKNQWDLLDNFAVAVASRDTPTTDGLRAIKMERAFFHSRSYFENGWAEEVTSEGPKEQTWYLHHHIVSQQGPEAMKYRIVVDGSVKFEGTSLNEQLDSGLKLQADLLGILLRFRRFQVALQSDITSGLARGGPRCLPFLLEELSTGNLICSPYLSMQVVNHHLSEKRDCFRTVVDEIKAGMYIDDFVVSCHTIAEAKDFVRRSSELLSSGGFYLAKWASNAPEALVDRPTEKILKNKHNCLGKTLGLLEPAGG
ncbi:hypothetical protein T12_5979 [Trichinella patagoniensis]|uniref:Reverse transcriptase domain-containing protein n=1 Tax=Trichinella patagoniensis TaxID=990121 RepID=A0A0V1AFM1_9BILA|nr:hypothetical protein T12_5979 [Trichinella patagoniensis]